MRKPKGINVTFVYAVPDADGKPSALTYLYNRTMPAVPQRDDTVHIYDSKLPYRLRVVDVRWISLSHAKPGTIEVQVAEFPTPIYEIPEEMRA